MDAARGFDLRETYVHVSDGPTVVPIDGGAAFWATVDERPELQNGRLLLVSTVAETWGHWERHPAGEEIVYAVSGSYEFVLEEPAGERRIALGPGSACIVPRAVWHRAIVHEPGEMLFLTRGAGTEHRPR
jgi:quercetin dioxygenase-like cupin family protein